jgi:putative toxin-antitoxin system antitoxin component (TIGR02293 family)
MKKTLGLFDGDREEARVWLTSPRQTLNEDSPLEFASTEVGAREVEDLIGRLERGVFT